MKEEGGPLAPYWIGVWEGYSLPQKNLMVSTENDAILCMFWWLLVGYIRLVS